VSTLTLRERIEDGRVHVLDGAMGTLLYDRGVFVNVCYDALALERPDLVRRIHEEYAAAGAGILETNTFGANPVKLSSYGLDGDTETLNRAAARLAREATEGRPDVHVLGAMGPLGIRIEPWGPTSREEAEDHFRRQVAGLLEGGVDGFCLETFGDVHEIEAAFRAVRSLSDLPVIAQVTVSQAGTTSYGTSAADAARSLTAMGADVVGLNCSVGPAAILEALEDMEPHTDRPLSAQPNAGLPRTVRDRKIYMASPGYMARYARRLIDSGVRFIGGCCGTTPDHIKLIADTVRSLQPRHATVRVADPSDALSVPATPPVPLDERSALGARLAAGEPLTTVELLPPRGWNGAMLLEQARQLARAGIDCVSLVDSPRSGSRMAAIAAGLLLVREAARLRSDAGGADGGRRPRLPEPLVHYTCRDRNMMGMVGDLLGAAAGGVRNLLLVSGDPPVQGPYPDSTAVFDIDSIGLTNVVRGLNHGVDPGGGVVGDPTPFVVGVAANPGAVDMERELNRFMWKTDAGADFAVTQPVFVPADLEAFLQATDDWPLPVVVGLWPLTSLRNADYLANEVPGVAVPPGVLERMLRAAQKGGDHARREGIAIAVEVLEAVRGFGRVSGFAVTAPGDDVEAALGVLDAVER
jgi:homocysteine S-methyltransferase